MMWKALLIDADYTHAIRLKKVLIGQAWEFPFLWNIMMCVVWKRYVLSNLTF